MTLWWITVGAIGPNIAPKVAAVSYLSFFAKGLNSYQPYYRAFFTETGIIRWSYSFLGNSRPSPVLPSCLKLNFGTVLDKPALPWVYSALDAVSRYYLSELGSLIFRVCIFLFSPKFFISRRLLDPSFALTASCELSGKSGAISFVQSTFSWLLLLSIKSLKKRKLWFCCSRWTV